MKTSIDLLSLKERQALALLYDSEAYKVLKKIHDLTVQGLGKDALVAPDMNAVNYLKGRAYQSKVTMDLIKEVYKQADKKS